MIDHYGIGSNFGVIADRDTTQDLGACSDFYSATNSGNAGFGSGAQGHLLENEAVGTDLNIWMDDNTVGVS